MKLCDHGCGQPAIHTTKGSLKSGPFKGAPVHQCAKSANSCSAVKQRKVDSSRKKYGTDHPLQNKEILNKRDETNLKKYGHKSSIMNPEIQAKRVASMMDRYGVENTTENPVLLQKVINGVNKAYENDPTIMDRANATKRKRYGNKMEKVIEKTRKTKEDNGNWVRQADLTAWKKYKRLVSHCTYYNYRDHKETINPNDLPLSHERHEHQLDHIYSKRAGFENNVPAEVIGHQANLQIITAKENRDKSTKCDITIEELYESINNT